MSKDMVINYEEYYNDAYFTGRRTYRTADGKEHIYHGPSLTWGGFDQVADAIGSLMKAQGVESVLDIGCSGGDLAKRLMQRWAFKCWGIEISKYAIDNCVPEMVGRIALADITTCPNIITQPRQYDLVMATDLLEHIYEEDLDHTFKWMMSKTKRWMFFCVAVAHDPTSIFGANKDKLEFVAKKGQPIPIEFEGVAAAGHVNVRSWRYWVKYFMKQGLKVCWDLSYMFQMQRELDKAWRDTGGWNMSTTWFLEKV